MKGYIAEVRDMKKERKIQESFEKTEDVVSATECTGLMPALPKDEAQDINYAQLYGIHSAEKPCPKYRRR